MQTFFAHWQARYAAVGIPIFPVQDKKPIIRAFAKVGLRGSAKLAQKYAAAEAFGLMAGRTTNISVLDIDSSDENTLEKALASFGPTPFIVRTGGSHYHAWYSYNGEPRVIRPFTGEPIDILGSGFVIAPPSRTGQGYSIIHGSLEDLGALPRMRLPSVRPQTVGRKRGLVSEGSRNDYLFYFAMVQARHTDDQATLLDVVQTENENACNPALTEKEVEGIARSAWRYQVEGRNFVGTKQIFASSGEIEDLATSCPDALALLMILRSHHRKGSAFVLAKAMAPTLGWTIPRFRQARAELENSGLIRCLNRGGRGPHDPPTYVFA